MRIVVYEFMSLDGVAQAPGGADEDTEGGFTQGGWSMPYFDPEVMGAAISEGMNVAEGLLFGRRTWQVMAAAWPERAGDPYADQMNALKKYVASRTLTPNDLTWNNSTLLSKENVLADVAALRSRDGGDLVVWGSLSLVRTLLSHGLVDELNVFIEPVLLGGGKRFFPQDGTAWPMKLVRCETAATGVLVCTYEPAR
ncbi:MAG TPA: dihydrofolate reductase family protein [Acidimicrobiales bacterium]|jgi:dihydrofolate reductase|nr:dihydrofolate reductase family protein [Acidimicrobiales bacterium]